jgi:hypothetical protein
MLSRRPVIAVLSLVALASVSACRGHDDVTGARTELPTSSTSTTSTTSTMASTSTTSTTSSTSTTSATSTSAATTAPSAPVTYDVATIEGSAIDPARGREVRYLAYAPVGLDGPVPVILVSHGGAGNEFGHRSAPYLGTAFAEGGFVAIHIGHLPSDVLGGQLTDRPADVSFILDQLEAGAIEMPTGFTGSIDLDRVGHTGHSFGAYTAHAVAGATYARTYRDERIDAIAPISPQGPDQFGGFDDGPDDNTWATVEIPVYNLIGGDEIDSNAVDSIVRPGWRLVPFERYPGTSDTFRTVIDGQGHADMWREGSPEVQQFIAREILEFMRVYAAGDVTTDPCGIGIGDLALAHTERRPATTSSLISTC